MLLTDSSKAFDSINHELLIEKLRGYGFSLESLAFIKSYLSDQIERIKINSSLSDDRKPESGMQWGSISEHLIFDIFICDFLM